MTKLRLMIVGLIACALLAIPAFAQTAAVEKTQINFGPLLAEVWPLIGVAVTALATWLAARIAGYFKLQSSAIVADTLNAAMQRGLDFARQKIGDGPTVGVESKTVAIAAQYVIDHTPDALKFLKVDDASLKEKLTARLGDGGATVNAS